MHMFFLRFGAPYSGDHSSKASCTLGAGRYAFSGHGSRMGYGHMQRRTFWSRHLFGRPVYEKATDAEGNNPNISTWHYDSLGRVTRAVCDGHSYEYVYDAQGNLKEKRSSGKRLVSYAYDRMGQITEIKIWALQR